MKRSIQQILWSVIGFFLLACQAEKSSSKEEILSQSMSLDINQIRQLGVLRAMTTYSATSYFLYRGEPMGYEYELLQRFADHLEVNLEIVVTEDIDSMFYYLNTGRVDLIAHGLTITKERKAEVSFSDYLYLVNQVLVQRKPDNWRNMSWTGIQKNLINDPIELIGDTIAVRRETSYFSRLQHLSEEIGGEIIIDTLPGHLSTDEIIHLVVDKELNYTIADNNIAAINASYYPVLDISVPISFSQRVAWAVSKESDLLLAELNGWIQEMKGKNEYYAIYNKYFKNRKDFRRRVKSEFYSLNNSSISEYDQLIQKYAEKIGWDWRLLSALVYQESRFQPEATSWAEAKGLMQLMPGTARDLGVEDRADPEQSLYGGTKYLRQLFDHFQSIPDTLERMKFAMASFNAGLGHVEDARRLAKANGINPSLWDNNVEEAILELSFASGYNHPVVKYGYVRGIEPYTYVDQIMERYGHYLQFIQRDPEDLLVAPR
ncbi:MAG: transporter substrate-binding domain-containing protein [Flavobacteriales bacterium]|nr:transporter substrate-binding domain-containing protein [Flavobacteriales bacterium]